MNQDERYAEIRRLAGTDCIVLNATINETGIWPTFEGQKALLVGNMLRFAGPFPYSAWEPVDDDPAPA